MESLWQQRCYLKLADSVPNATSRRHAPARIYVFLRQSPHTQLRGHVATIRQRPNMLFDTEAEPR